MDFATAHNGNDPVLSRRSIRKYTDRTIPEEYITVLLKAGMAAPSADDERPWHFIVIRDRALLGRIPSVHPFAGALTTARTAILVCGDETLQKVQGFWVQDCSAATQNILIEAEELKLGAVWLGIYPFEGRVEGFRNLLNIPEGVIPFALVSIGYPEEHKEPANRYDSSRVHFELW
jgi:nitroreductase